MPLYLFNVSVLCYSKSEDIIVLTGGRLTEIHLIKIVFFQLIESYNNELIHI